ncbi:MAG: HAD-IA family hydrolase [Microcoleaceae cyanobacterium]
MPKITHLIYDLDGLLLDTETLHTKVNQMIANRYGQTIDPELQFKLCGRKSKDSAKLIVETLKLPVTVETFIQEKDAIIYQYYVNVPPLAGAVRLTKHFAAHQIPQAIATSSSSRPFSAKTQSHQAWFSIFQYIINGDNPSIKQGKPAPDIFLITAEELGTKPEQCLVFEDSLAGVAAARAAQMSVVAVPAPDMDKSLYKQADQVLNSLAEFQPQDWGLPAFKQ